jgi:hypothetical protein
MLRVAAAGIFAMFFPSALAGCGRGPAPQTNAGTPATVPSSSDGDAPHLQGEVYVPEPVMGIVACPAPTETPEGAPEDDAPPK